MVWLFVHLTLWPYSPSSRHYQTLSLGLGPPHFCRSMSKNQRWFELGGASDIPRFNPHLTDEETKPQRGEVTHLRKRRPLGARLSLEVGHLVFLPHHLSIPSHLHPQRPPSVSIPGHTVLPGPGPARAHIGRSDTLSVSRDVTHL